MISEHWNEIKDKLHAALELEPAQRDAYLQELAAANPELLCEVESLLSAHNNAGTDFLQTSSPYRPTLTKGTKLGEYEVLTLLGSGGMGEVYRARDARLGRDVAIKVLPWAVTFRDERLRRFELEARAAAALSHPNILAVYQMGTHEGIPYLVSELLEGETLREHIRRGAIPLRSAIDYAVQVARGLAVAHEKGIVHRDLKPENLFVTKDGRAKILDFGLAKLTQSQHGEGQRISSASNETEPGVMMGTVGYMSPEQVRAKTVDHRADIFAFGAILYEMLTAKRAFGKPTSVETMAAIMNEDVPSMAATDPEISPGLQRIVNRCLEKKPDLRFQSMSDLAFALETLSDLAISPRARPGRPYAKRLKRTAGSAVAISALALIVSLALPRAVPRVESVTQLTNDGEPKEGELASDGTRIYFNEGESGSWRISQVSTNGGKTAPVETRFANLHVAAMTPDNSTLMALVGGFKEPYAAWLLPLPAGEPRRLSGIDAQDASFFPDARIVFAQGSRLYVSQKEGANPKQLVELPQPIWAPSISPDAKRIVFDSSSLQEVNTDGSGLRPALKPEWKFSVPCCGRWTPDGKYLLFQSEQEGRSDLWALPEDGGLLQRQSPVHLTQGPLSYTHAIPSQDGTKIFAIGSQRRGELVRYDEKSRAFIPYSSGISAMDFTFSTDGKWVAYLTYPDHTLWRSRSDGTEREQVTLMPQPIIYPIISPDGKKIAFGTFHGAYVVSVDDGRLQKIAERGIAAAWSPDGNLLVITASVGGELPAEEEGTDLRSIDMRRTELELFDMRNGKISRVPGSEGKVGGLWVTQHTIVAATEDNLKFLVFDFETQKWTELALGAFVNWVVSPDGRYLYCTTGGSEPNLLRIRFADHHVETVTTLKNIRRAVDVYTGTQLSVAPDGSALFTRDIGVQEIYALKVRWE